MCRYNYGKDKCAHPRNFTIECIGENACSFISNDAVDMTGGMSNSVNSNEADDQDRCPNTECGIYCDKYNRFYCAGLENCQTEKEYLKHMNMHGYTQ